MIQSRWPKQLVSFSIVGASLVTQGPGTAGAQESKGVRLYYRMLAEGNNAPFPAKTRSILAMDGEERTRSTGMADSGFTEYPFCHGKVSYTLAESFMYFPRFVSGVEVDPSKVNTGDILLPQAYSSEGVVWGVPAREFVQTFRATGRELVSASLQIPSATGRFRAALVEGGPGGRQIGSSRLFEGGMLQWSWARWKPGEAPLEPGRTYGIRIWRDDGAVWTPSFHATGDAYAEGHLFLDGQPRPRTDLAVWIVEEPPDVSRGVLLGGDDDERIYDATGFEFVARTPNIRLISVEARPVAVRCRIGQLTVWSTGKNPRRLAGPKQCVSCGSDRTSYSVHFLYAQDELKVEEGGTYRGELRWVPYREKAVTEGEPEAVPMDVRVWVYGETDPGAWPAIYNLGVSFAGKGDMTLKWQTTFPASVTVELERLSPYERTVHEVEAGTTELFLPLRWRGHDYRWRLAARGPSGQIWKTPAYQMRIPDGPHGPGPAYLYPEHPKEFIKIAPPTRTDGLTAREVLRFRSEVPLVNGDFEETLEGWTLEPAGVLSAMEEIKETVSPPFGKWMAGFNEQAGRQREQVKVEGILRQTIPTVPGHHYLLTARAHTSVENGPAGDTRVRLFADPRGGGDFKGMNTSQWYWTGGRWLRLEHEWTAEGERSTVGFGLWRWRDLDRASAFVDHAMVLDLGAAPLEPGDSATRGDEIPRVGLTDGKEEIMERVEAYAVCPPGYVITGLGARAAGDNVTTVRLRIQPLRADGTLGESEVIRAGWEPDAGLEANVDLPEGYVATGFGARIAPEWDVKTLAVWGRPLLPDGTLGEEKEFRGGIQPEGGLEEKVMLEPGRVLTSAGLRCSLNDVKGIRATSVKVVRTATDSRSRNH
jgi:hypothetical protein